MVLVSVLESCCKSKYDNECKVFVGGSGLE